MMQLGPGLSALTVVAISVFLGFPAAGRGEDAPRTASAGPARPDWGTRDRILQHIGFSEFSPEDSATTYTGGQSFQRYSTSGVGIFWASLHVPSGALLQYLELDYRDIDPLDNVFLNLFDCSFLGADCQGLGGGLSSGDGGLGEVNYVSADLSGLGYTMNNNTRALYLRAITQAGDAGTALRGAYVGYKLQVSTPAPGAQTFGDVPPSHPFYKFVEAVAAAGITSGCGGGKYCPDAPLTRGQIAVFLARALGLHFPN